MRPFRCATVLAGSLLLIILYWLLKAEGLLLVQASPGAIQGEGKQADAGAGPNAKQVQNQQEVKIVDTERPKEASPDSFVPQEDKVREVQAAAPAGQQSADEASESLVSSDQDVVLELEVSQIGTTAAAPGPNGEALYRQASASRSSAFDDMSIRLLQASGVGEHRGWQHGPALQSRRPSSSFCI